MENKDTTSTLMQEKNKIETKETTLKSFKFNKNSIENTYFISYSSIITGSKEIRRYNQQILYNQLNERFLLKNLSAIGKYAFYYDSKSYGNKMDESNFDGLLSLIALSNDNLFNETFNYTNVELMETSGDWGKGHITQNQENTKRYYMKPKSNRKLKRNDLFSASSYIKAHHLFILSPLSYESLLGIYNIINTADNHNKVIIHYQGEGHLSDVKNTDNNFAEFLYGLTPKGNLFANSFNWTAGMRYGKLLRENLMNHFKNRCFTVVIDEEVTEYVNDTVKMNLNLDTPYKNLPNFYHRMGQYILEEIYTYKSLEKMDDSPNEESLSDEKYISISNNLINITCNKCTVVQDLYDKDNSTSVEIIARNSVNVNLYLVSKEFFKVVEKNDSHSQIIQEFDMKDRTIEKLDISKKFLDDSSLPYNILYHKNLGLQNGKFFKYLNFSPNVSNDSYWPTFKSSINYLSSGSILALKKKDNVCSITSIENYEAVIVFDNSSSNESITVPLGDLTILLDYYDLETYKASIYKIIQDMELTKNSLVSKIPGIYENQENLHELKLANLDDELSNDDFPNYKLFFEQIILYYFNFGNISSDKLTATIPDNLRQILVEIKIDRTHVNGIKLKNLDLINDTQRTIVENNLMPKIFQLLLTPEIRAKVNLVNSRGIEYIRTCDTIAYGGKMDFEVAPINEFLFVPGILYTLVALTDRNEYINIFYSSIISEKFDKFVEMLLLFFQKNNLSITYESSNHPLLNEIDDDISAEDTSSKFIPKTNPQLLNKVVDTSSKIIPKINPQLLNKVDDDISAVDITKTNQPLLNKVEDDISPEDTSSKDISEIKQPLLDKVEDDISPEDTSSKDISEIKQPLFDKVEDDISSKDISKTKEALLDKVDYDISQEDTISKHIPKTYHNDETKLNMEPKIEDEIKSIVQTKAEDETTIDDESETSLYGGSNSYNKIINPQTGNKVSVKGILGKRIINKYINLLNLKSINK